MCDVILAISMFVAQVNFSSASAAVPVYLELVMEKGFPVGQERVWLEVLAKLPDVSIRIRAAELGERPEITPEGRGWRILGVLTRGNRLVVPGAQFSLTDQAALAAYLKKLRDDGPDAVRSPAGPYGLTEAHFRELLENLQSAVEQPTKDVPLDKFVRHIAERSGIPIDVDPALQARWASYRVQDDLSGLSLGTALAVGVRAWGWVVAVERSRGTTRLRITQADRAAGFWPIGYLPQDTLRQTVPALFSYLTVEINDTPLSEVLAALQSRLGVPILVDHNAAARLGVRLDEVRVTVPSTRTYYKRILDQALTKARLRAELRVDEAGHPFLWITTTRTIP